MICLAWLMGKLETVSPESSFHLQCICTLWWCSSKLNNWTVRAGLWPKFVHFGFVVKYSKALTAPWSIPTLWQEHVLPIIIIIFYKNNTVGGCQTLLCLLAHPQVCFWVRNPPSMLVYGVNLLIDWLILIILCLPGESLATYTFTFSHLADAFIQSDLQLGNT